MSDGTVLNTGVNGDTLFDEDVSSDTVGGFAGKIAGTKIYHGIHGTLGVPVSNRTPLPIDDGQCGGLLELILGEFQLLRSAVAGGAVDGNHLLDVLSEKQGNVLVAKSGAFVLGTAPADTGTALRLSPPTTTGSIQWAVARRNIGNTNNVFLLGAQTDGVSTEEIYIGHGVLGTPNTLLKLESGTSVQIRVGSANPAVSVSATLMSMGVPIDIGTNYVQFGAAPAATGPIRLSNNGRITWRNAGNTADLQGLVFDGANSCYVGDITNGQYLATTGTQLIFAIAASTIASIDASGVLISTGALRIGGAPAATGALRLSNNTALVFRNGGGTADISVLLVDSGNNFKVGVATSDCYIYANTHVFIGSASAEIGRWSTTCLATVSGVNFSVGNNAPNYNSGTNTTFIASGTAPSANPTGGGYLYAVAGAGTWRGTSGTISTFGPADLEGFLDTPGKGHCPSCGTDFAHEWYNAKYGGLTVCMRCLTDEIGDRPWIVRRSSF